MLLVLWLLVSWWLKECVRADCEACVAGWCHARKTLIQGFRITDQLAIDHTNNILYVQINSTQNTAFYLDELKVQLVLTSNTSGMAVDQESHILYLAGYRGDIYEYKKDRDAAELTSIEMYEPNAERLCFYKGKLYYTSKYTRGINFITGNETKFFDDLLNYTITDFVVNENGSLYFVANETVYAFTVGVNSVEVVAPNNYVLSTDKYGGVYFGDAAVNVIYSLNEFHETVAYAAYVSGSVDKFVFDQNDNIVFYDSTEDTIGTWRNESKPCTIEAPRLKYHVNKIVPDACSGSISENFSKATDATEIIKHCLSSRQGLADFCECLKRYAMSDLPETDGFIQFT